jgi:microcystin synthetase protein McyJ
MHHEARVERFYAHGVARYGSFHDNYLNFGLWTPGRSFVEAAEALVERVGTKIALGGDAALLDVGCGMGTQDRFLMRRFRPRTIEAVDLTPQHIAIAQARNEFANLTYRVGNACVLPFPNGAFTHAMSIEGIVHFNTRQRFFREARRVLVPGGRFGASDFFMPRAPRNLLERRLLRLCMSAWQVPPDNASSAEEYHAALERSGFTDVHVEIVSDQVIPGYYAEQMRPDTRRHIRAIRGPVIGRLSQLIDVFLHRLYRARLVGYLIVDARKPQEEP